MPQDEAPKEEPMTSAKKYATVAGKRMAYVESGGGERVTLRNQF